MKAYFSNFIILSQLYYSLEFTHRLMLLNLDYNDILQFKNNYAIINSGMYANIPTDLSNIKLY